MSDPISQLSKNKKKPPLFLPEMPTPTPMPTISAYNNYTPRSDLNPTDRGDVASSLSCFNSGYVRTPTKKISSYLPLNSNNAYASHQASHRSSMTSDSPFGRVPFKTAIEDSDLMDEVTTTMALNNLKRNTASLAPSKSGQNDKVPNDMELMQIMMSKIKSVEAKCAVLEKESREKDKRIKELEEKLDLYKKKEMIDKGGNPANSDYSSSLDAELIQDLAKKNYVLQQQVYEMEDFLADYGLYWRGSGSENSNHEEEEEHGNESSVKYDKTKINEENFVCDYDLITRNVQELNSLVDYSEAKIVEYPNGAKFETPDPIRFTLYSNGIALFNGPFRPFSDASTRKFCIDIMDGYYPSELESKYPDGVPFELVDKRDVSFSTEKNPVFKTKGYRLGSGSQVLEKDMSDKGSSSTPTNENEIEAQNESHNSSKVAARIESQLLENPLTIEQFLNKLPTAVVKNGKLIDIRNDLSQLITGADNKKVVKSQASIIETPALAELREKHSEVKNPDELFKIKDDESSRVTTLRIKSVNGDQCYLIKMHYSDTIQDLKNVIKAQRGDSSSTEDFDLASMYPRKTFDNPDMTLEACDLVKNTNIMLIPRKSNTDNV